MIKKYTADHEWIAIDDDVAMVGVSKHASDKLGDITYVELPENGTDLIVGDTIGVVESVKSASDIYSPISGRISAVNINLEDYPSLINESPEDNGWICKISDFDESEIEELMSEKDYQSFVSSEK